MTLLLAGAAWAWTAAADAAPSGRRPDSAAQPRPEIGPDLERAVRSALRASGLDRATIAVSVRDPATGRELVEVAGARPMIPASNMKLLTSGAALHLLGPEFAFETHLCAGLSEVDRSRAERLIVVGSGDPGFGDPALLERTRWRDASGAERVGMTTDELVGIWVEATVAAGLRSVGTLVVDDRVFDREHFHPAWPAGQRLQRSFAEVAGLNVQVNVLRFLLRPGSGPHPEIVAIRPASPWLEVQNRATTKTGKSDQHAPAIARAADRNAFTIQGNVKFAAVDPIEIPLRDPPRYFAELLAHRLRAAGVSVDAVRLADADDPRAIEGGRLAPGFAGIGPIIRTPLAEVLLRCNTNSQNVHAEALLKRLAHASTGRPGAWSDGAEAIRRAVSERLPDHDLGALAISDGSGLSRENRLSASLLTEWLASFERDPRLGSPLFDSLAIGGETGTLRRRFGALSGSPVSVRCKTGYIRGVSCLAGFVVAEDGSRLAFAVLGNDLVRAGEVDRMKKLQEAVVEAITAAQSAAPRRASR